MSEKPLKIVLSLVVIFLLIISLIPISFAYSTPVTTANGMLTSFDTIIDNGTYFFQFYVDSATSFIYYKSSLDGISWNAAQGATSITVGNVDYPFAVYSKANNVWLAYHNGNNLYVRNGTISGDLISFDANTLLRNTGTPLFIGGFFETDNYIWLLSHDLSGGFYRFSTWSMPTNSTTNTWTIRLNQVTVDTLNPGFANGFRGAKVPWYSDGYFVIASQRVANYYYRIYNFTTLINEGAIGTKANGVNLINQFDVEYWDNEIFFTYKLNADYDTYYSKTNSSISWLVPTVVNNGDAVNNPTYSPKLVRGNNKLYMFSVWNHPGAIYDITRNNYTGSTWLTNETLDTTPAAVYVNSPKNPDSDRIGISVYATGNPHNIYFYAMSQDVSPAGQSLNGVLCSNSVNEANNSIVTLSSLTSIVCVADFKQSVIINQTGYSIANYTNQFMDGRINLAIYTAYDTLPISDKNPLKIIWSKTYNIANGTENEQIVYYPNLFIKDHTYVALVLSVNLPVSFNSTSSTDTQYTHNKFAPLAIPYLVNSSNRVQMYALWNLQNVTFSNTNFYSGTIEQQYSLPLMINSFWISIGIPPFLGGLLVTLFTGLAVGLIILVKKISEPEKIFAILMSLIIFGLSVMNIIPMEFALVIIVAIVAIFASKVAAFIAER